MCAELTDYSFNSNNYNPDPYFKILDLFFNQPVNVHVKHHIESFGSIFVDEIIPSIVNGEHIIHDRVIGNTIIKHKLVFSNLSIKPPYVESKKKLMFPMDAIHNNLNYFSKCYADVVQIVEQININTGESTEKVISTEKEVPYGGIPIMIKSKYCNLTLNPELAKYHCPFDHGGYFIVNGGEKVVLSLESSVPRKPMVYIEKGQGYKHHYVRVESIPDTKFVGNTQKFALKIKKDGSIVLEMLYFKEVSVFTLMRALGLENDNDIIYAITNPNDKPVYNQLLISMNTSISPVVSQEEAIQILITLMRTTKKYSETNKELRERQKREHLMRALKNILLPHVKSDTDNESTDLMYKAYFIGYTINRLIKCYLKKDSATDSFRGCDDRDSLFNKRVELSGILLGTLFEQSFNKLLSDCSKFLKTKNVDGNKTPSIIKYIKSNQIEQTLRQALSTGDFKTQARRGISQTLNRLNYDHSLTYMKRVMTPMPDSSSKITGPLHLHNTQYGSLCPLETPEGQKTGILKNMAMTTTITVGKLSQIIIVKSILKDNIIPLSNKKYIKKLHTYVKIFINDNWIGLSNDIISLHNKLRNLRFKGEIDSSVSFVINYIEREYKIYTDTGRFIRPYLTVSNNEINFKPDMLKNVKDWNDLITNYPEIIEFVDKEEEKNMMLALFPTDIENAKKIMNNPGTKDINKINMINQINRYDDNIFVKYSHCEIHPSMILGAISINMPFPNHTQAPRGIYHYNQRKQAMGLYASNYRHRIDNSYILYHLQVPIVSSRTKAFTNGHLFPCGENAIVAISSYYGFNQDDSLAINNTAVELGFFRATSLKKQKEEIKGTTTAPQSGLFMKPDPSRVSGIKKDANYEKIEENGYPKLNTYVKSGDVIIGIGLPRSVTQNDDKPYRDNSVIYKSHVPGRIDGIVTGTSNDDNPFIKIRISQERIPNVGDKLSSRHAQKGTIGIKAKRPNLPYTKKGIVPHIIINPNCIPKRMTIGQLIETLLGKVCAIKGIYGDSTPFMGADIYKMNEELVKLGYEEWGNETMYNGVTGEKMQTKIFIGPTYYHRLKQMVGDKIHSRAEGQNQLLTRQPTEGRSRDGGLKIGEMERDALCCHGISQFMKEAMIDKSDIYKAYICDICGFFAHKIPTKNYYGCPACNNTTRITRISIPYTFKLFMQELRSLGVNGKIRTANSI